MIKQTFIKFKLHLANLNAFWVVLSTKPTIERLLVKSFIHPFSRRGGRSMDGSRVCRAGPLASISVAGLQQDHPLWIIFIYFHGCTCISDSNKLPDSHYSISYIDILDILPNMIFHDLQYSSFHLIDWILYSNSWFFHVPTKYACIHWLVSVWLERDVSGFVSPKLSIGHKGVTHKPAHAHIL